MDAATPQGKNVNNSYPVFGEKVVSNVNFKPLAI